MAPFGIDAAEVRRRVGYDAQTGVLFWREDPCRGRQVGDPLACGDNGNGYIYAAVNRRKVAVHRLAFLVVTGRWPEEVDHINGDRSDNRWENLREATRLDNARNVRKGRRNTSGFKGANLHSARRRWRASIQVNGRHISLGYHPSAEAAHAAYVAAAEKHFGGFARAE